MFKRVSIAVMTAIVLAGGGCAPAPLYAAPHVVQGMPGFEPPQERHFYRAVMTGNKPNRLSQKGKRKRAKWS